MSSITEPLLPSDIRTYLAAISEAERQLIKIFRPDDELIIFDVGSCEGEDSIRYAHRFPRAKLFAFEPLPENLSLMHANFQAYKVKNAEVVPQALSNQPGYSEFYVSSGTPKELFAGERWNYGNKSSSLLPPAHSEPMYGWIKFTRAIKVATTTLDDFCTQREIKQIDFIHMDVQGAERLVLFGAAKILRNVVAIWLEVSDVELYRGQALRKEIRQLLTSHGFFRSHVFNREFEGDELYVNLRYPRMWLYLTAQYSQRQLARLMFRTGAIKNWLLHIFNSQNWLP